MSFQSFRLGEIAQQPLPPHLLQLQQGQPSSSSILRPINFEPVSKRAPYGSGDSDDGYTLVFPNLDAFHDWRRKEEEAHIVEFVKGDTHGSKAVPPRFKEHTKLVCARHSRSGRKKYVKKHPERVRKVPSRKIEGQGCSASISFKTYLDTEEVRACYISQHSHETGLANLPFTRRGRKAAAEQNKSRTIRRRATSEDGPTASPQPSTATSFPAMVNPLAAPPPQAAPYPQVPPPPPSFYHHSYPYQPPPPHSEVTLLGQDRWQNMETLFNSVRQHARTFVYPVASVAALESVLIRLFLESPQAAPGISAPPPPPPMQPARDYRNDEEEESGSE
ncbi:hypothetical protein E1B28_007506 [Marasmius oreades]|uniref:Uncharacterized protein n=1 Tax=Marasmius oreades TaxID=181124 RepID=A0A9P7S3I1_9AGAR|nr:uncharacterized protein E1B28_007506 [Marasmius oreades]KAG7093868.1 hypothetical protein E1B28_007506 [Marasmius oreades]